MKYTLRHTSTFGTFEVIAPNGAVCYRGPLTDAARELSRLNAAATVLPTVSERKRERMQRIAEREAGR